MGWIRPSWRLARSDFAGRRGRSRLLLSAVAAAAALVAAISCAMATVQASWEHRIEGFIGGATIRVVHSFNGRFAERWLEELRSWPEVETATGRLDDELALARRDGALDPETGEPARVRARCIGVELDLDPIFRHLDLIDGRRPSAEDEILVGPMVAEALGAGVGDELVLVGAEDQPPLRVVGIYERQLIGALQRPMIRLSRARLAAVSGQTGRISGILAVTRDGVDVEQLCADRADAMPMMLALEPAKLARTGFDRQVRASRLSLVLTTLISFMAASFIIVTGMTTAVSERQRELAVLRCVGASRRQLFLAQLGHGAIIGGLGAAAGIPIGLGLAAALAVIFRSHLPAGFHVHLPGLALSATGALVAGLVAAVYPAWLASRVAPLRAMTRRGRAPTRWGPLLCLAVAVALITIQLLLMGLPDHEARFWSYLWFGLPGLFLAYFLLAAPVLLVVGATVGAIATRLLRLPRGLLLQSMRAMPLRHGFTAGALMVGVCFLVGDRTAMNALLDDWIGTIRFADGFAIRKSGISAEQQRTIAELPFVERTCPIGYLPVKVMDEQVFGVGDLLPPYVVCIGFQPRRFLEMNKIEWDQGDPDTAVAALEAGEGILVADRFLTAGGVQLGDVISLGAPRRSYDFEIVGVVSSAGLDIATELFGIRSAYLEMAFSCVFMDFDTFAERWDNDDALLLQVDLADTVTDAEATELITDAVPGVGFFSGRWILDTIDEIAGAITTVQLAVAFGALFLAVIGAGQVLLADVHSRRYEYGVLRAVGRAAEPGAAAAAGRGRRPRRHRRHHGHRARPAPRDHGDPALPLPARDRRHRRAAAGHHRARVRRAPAADHARRAARRDDGAAAEAQRAAGRGPGRVMATSDWRLAIGDRGDRRHTPPPFAIRQSPIRSPLQSSHGQARHVRARQRLRPHGRPAARDRGAGGGGGPGRRAHDAARRDGHRQDVHHGERHQRAYRPSNALVISATTRRWPPSSMKSCGSSSHGTR